MLNNVIWIWVCYSGKINEKELVLRILIHKNNLLAKLIIIHFYDHTFRTNLQF